MKLLDRYPILARLPAAQRAAVAAKSDAGLPLTPEECTALGLAACDSLVLMPQTGSAGLEQMAALFGGDLAALGDILRLKQRTEAA